MYASHLVFLYGTVVILGTANPDLVAKKAQCPHCAQLSAWELWLLLKYFCSDISGTNWLNSQLTSDFIVIAFYELPNRTPTRNAQSSRTCFISKHTVFISGIVLKLQVDLFVKAPHTLYHYRSRSSWPTWTESCWELNVGWDSLACMFRNVLQQNCMLLFSDLCSIKPPAQVRPLFCMSAHGFC